MKYDFVLTSAQQVLVEEHLSVIDTVLGLFINTDETVCGLGYRDLYQEGAVAPCAGLYLLTIAHLLVFPPMPRL